MDANVKPRLSAPTVGLLALAFTFALMVGRLRWVEVVNPNIVPKGLAALPFAVMTGLGLAVVFGLAWANRGRMRAVLRPNPGRVIGALVLGFVTPVAVYSWLPWIIGGLWLTLGFTAFDAFVFGLGVVLLAAALWYPIACLIVSGIHSRLMRVAVFALMFWAGYGLVMLVSGTLLFML